MLNIGIDGIFWDIKTVCIVGLLFLDCLLESYIGI